MKTYLDCVSCLVRQAVDAVKVAAPDEETRMKTLRAVLEEATKVDYASSPPAMGGRIHRVIREATGNPDPYLEMKKHCNRLALDGLEDLRARVDASSDPLDTAVRIAIAGNVMDFSVLEAGEDVRIEEAIDAALQEPFGIDHLDAFREAVDEADSILYLADNAGEIVLDNLLLDRLPAGHTVVSVKGSPIINDALMEDAEEAGITRRFEVITTGSSFPGVLPETCSRSFLDRLERADLVIAKGQANYESLEGTRRGIFHLFRAKCSIVSRDVGVPQGSWVVMKG